MTSDFFSEIRKQELSLDENTLKYVKDALDGLKYVNHCFLLDAKRRKSADIQYLEGVQSGFNFCLKEIERLINKEPT